MALRPTLQPRLTQQLALTPQLRKAIEILQMSQQEIHSLVETELESNPVLERDENSDIPAIKETSDVSSVDRILADHAKIGEQAPHDATQEPFFESSVGQFPYQGSGVFNENASLNPLENVAFSKTLKDHLRDQLSLITDQGNRRRAAEIIIGELDTDGFLRTELDDLAMIHDVPIETLAKGLKSVQSCEPTGIGARNLAECFHLQISDLGTDDEDLTILLQHATQAKTLDLGLLEQLCGLSKTRFLAAFRRLCDLNQSPGDVFGETQIEYVVPDVIVSSRPNGEFSVELNSEALPKLLIANHYEATINNDRESAEFISECMSRANWLTRTLAQRSRTILKIAKELVRQQYAFFENGPDQLKGMTMRELAENVGAHESTVSRVATGKYLTCRYGTFELKYFFSKAIRTSGGNSQVSSKTIQEKIRRIIATETFDLILSDDAIAKTLSKDGIDVARRTVTKYREAIRIPSSTERRKLKRPKTPR